jgi:cytochrome c5
MPFKPLLLPILCLMLLAACGKPESAPVPTAKPETPLPAAQPTAETPTLDATAAAPAAVDAAIGEAIYKKTCFLCHGTGTGGAPLLTDSADWAPRVAQGNDVLYQHAIVGFTGSKGMMPPKGANMALSDDEIKATVDYMLSQVK